MCRELVPLVKKTAKMDEEAVKNEEDSDEESVYDFFARVMQPTPRQKKITIKFKTQDEKIFTQSYPETWTIEEVKNQLTDVFAVPGTYMEMQRGHDIMPNSRVLTDFNLPQYAALELKLFSKNDNYEIQADNAYKDLLVPDVIMVRVGNEEVGYKEIVVEIENRSIIKPFLGGFTNVENGLVYHHGYSQTGPRPPKIHPMYKNHRDTQTYFVRNRKLDTEYSRGTQMPNQEIWIPTVNMLKINYW